MGDFYGEMMWILRRPAVVETALDILLCAVPIWVAVMIGLVIGWSWRPRWTALLFLGLRSRMRLLWAAAPPGIGARRLWLAITALSAFSISRRIWSSFKGKEAAVADVLARGGGQEGGVRRVPSVPVLELVGGSSSVTSLEEEHSVTEKDLEHLLQFLDGKAGDLAWQYLMERTTPNMNYQAWRLEPEGVPVIYRSRTVFEDASPELVRDFFWDDNFRLKWDAMLSYCKVLQENQETGILTVHWIKKFPFFCSDREYIFSRRIWESGKTYYCVTKGVPYPSIPKSEKPRRVELYFSSWSIRAVESRRQDGQRSACEVVLIHYEDMGIPKDVAKVGVRHGMWGAIKKLQSGLRAYQLARKSETCLSSCALMARITTKIPTDGGVASRLSPENNVEDKGHITSQKGHHGIDWKWVVIGGVALACGLQTGLIGKSLLFGAAGRLARK